MALLLVCMSGKDPWGDVDWFKLREEALAQLQDDPVTPSALGALELIECQHLTTITDRKQGSVLCGQCGKVVDSFLCDVFGNTLPAKNIKPRSLYRRRHHFNERLSQWLVTVRRVPDEVIARVRAIITPPQAPGSSSGPRGGPVTKTRIRAALRSIGLQRHIEHWIEIFCELTHRPYPQISGDVLERIRDHFLAIENAFERNKPKDRKCLLSYNYIIVRLLQIYSLGDHTMWFPPLKSRAKLAYLDTVWSKMASTMGLPILPPPFHNKTLR